MTGELQAGHGGQFIGKGASASGAGVKTSELWAQQRERYVMTKTSDAEMLAGVVGQFHAAFGVPDVQEVSTSKPDDDDPEDDPPPAGGGMALVEEVEEEEKGCFEVLMERLDDDNERKMFEKLNKDYGNVDSFYFALCARVAGLLDQREKAAKKAALELEGGEA